LPLSRSPARFIILSCSLLGALGATAGCAGGMASAPVVSTDSVATRAPVAQNAHGPVRLVGAALGDVPLLAPQRAEVEKLASDAEARRGDIRVARRDLTLALASQVEAGVVDRAALAPKIEALASAAQRAQPADRAAFERLHAILGPDQRTAFVNALDARVHDRVRDVEDRHPLRQWAEDLKLTADQRAQLKAALKPRIEAMRHGPGDGRPELGQRRGAKLMAAFKQDRFVMDEVAPPLDAGAIVRTRSDRILGLIEQALPVLTPAQRTIAAQKLRDRAAGVEPDGPSESPGSP
jgi:Spy/CpxP family protein refolding chaperone